MLLKRILPIILVFVIFCVASLNSQTELKNNRTAKKPNTPSNLPEFKSLNPSINDQSSVSTSIGNAEPTRIDAKTGSKGKNTVPVKNIMSKSNNSIGKIERAENGTIRWWDGTLGHINSKLDKNSAQTNQSSSPVVMEAMSFLDNNKSILGLKNPTQELQLMNAQIDDLGYQHIRFEQIYKNLRVWAKDIYVHIDPKGEVYTVNGIYEPTPLGITTSPLVSENASIETAISDLKGRGNWNPVSESLAKEMRFENQKSELVIYPNIDKRIYLAYAVTLRANLTESWTYFVDARSGRYINRIQVHNSF